MSPYIRVVVVMAVPCTPVTVGYFVTICQAMMANRVAFLWSPGLVVTSISFLSNIPHKGYRIHIPSSSS